MEPKKQLFMKSLRYSLIALVLPQIIFGQNDGAALPKNHATGQNTSRPTAPCKSEYVLRVDPHGDVHFTISNEGYGLSVNGVTPEQSLWVKFDFQLNRTSYRTRSWNEDSPRFETLESGSLESQRHWSKSVTEEVRQRLNRPGFNYNFDAHPNNMFCSYKSDGTFQALEVTPQNKVVADVAIKIPKMKRVIDRAGSYIVVEGEVRGKPVVLLANLRTGEVRDTGLGEHIGVPYIDWHGENDALSDQEKLKLLSPQAIKERFISEVSLSPDGKYLAWIDKRSGMVGIMDIFPECVLGPPRAKTALDMIRDRAVGRIYWPPQQSRPSKAEIALEDKAKGILQPNDKSPLGSLFDVGGYLILQCSDSEKPDSPFLGELFIPKAQGDKDQNKLKYPTPAYFVTDRSTGSLKPYEKYASVLTEYNGMGLSKEKQEAQRKKVEPEIIAHWQQGAKKLEALQSAFQNLNKRGHSMLSEVPLSKEQVESLGKVLPEFSTLFTNSANREFFAFPVGFVTQEQAPIPGKALMVRTYTGGRNYLSQYSSTDSLQEKKSGVMMNVAPIWLHGKDDAFFTRKRNPRRLLDGNDLDLVFDGYRVLLQFKNGKSDILEFSSTDYEFAQEIKRTIWCVTVPLNGSTLHFR